MNTVKTMALIGDDSGATMIEYGLMAAFVAVAAVASLMASGETLSAIFDMVSSNMQAASAARQQ